MFGALLIKKDFFRGRGRKDALPAVQAGKADESRIGRIKYLLLMFQNRFALRLITATKFDFGDFVREKWKL